MINNGKTIIKEILRGVFGLMLGSMLYVYYFYVEGFMAQTTILFGLFALVYVWKKTAPRECKSKEAESKN